MQLEPFQASLLYKSLKLHFTTEKYDYTKYNGKVSGDTIAAKSKFLYNKQRFFFAKLGRHKDPVKLLIANLLDDPKHFITDIVDDAGMKLYEDLLGRIASRYYRLEKDLQHFKSVKELLITEELPPIINKYIVGDIQPESIILIDSVTRVLDKIDEQSHPLVEKHLLKLRKYRSFVHIDRGKVKTIFEKRWTP